MLVALALHCSKLSAAWDCKPNGVQGIAGGIVACSDAGIHYWDPDDWHPVVIHEEDGVCGLFCGEGGELEVVVSWDAGVLVFVALGGHDGLGGSCGGVWGL